MFAILCGAINASAALKEVSGFCQISAGEWTSETIAFDSKTDQGTRPTFTLPNGSKISLTLVILPSETYENREKYADIKLSVSGQASGTSQWKSIQSLIVRGLSEDPYKANGIFIGLATSKAISKDGVQVNCQL